jgi:peptidoglycan/LPS O-acetylase OafA/YrhL
VSTAHAHAPGSHSRSSATGKGRVDALDGLRAFALLIIMGYHFGVGWLQGGFFSLDIFYVLSGYLITGLLLGEYAKRDRINLPAFWLRRARRLLPALLVVLVVVTLFVRFAQPAGLYPDFRMAALSALFYFSNWWQIAASGNYFVATGAVSPLTHTWSLAVEEQFYLIWPLVVLAVLHLSRTFARGLRVLLVVSVAGAIGSAVEMAALYHPTANITRLYFGTDTHAQSILVGSVLACVMTMVQRRRGLPGMAPEARSAPARLILVVVGLAGLAGTLALTYALQGTSPVAYRGGFFLSALSAAALVTAAVTVRGGPIARVLSLPPLVWIGTISYGAYLWHYPVFIQLDAAHTGLTGFPLLLVRFSVTLALAAVSFYLIERPVMEGTFWRSLRAAAPATVMVGATVAVVLAGTVAPAVAVARPLPLGALPVAEKQALTADNAFHGDPVRFLLLGDSLAVTLGVGLKVDAAAHYGVDVVNKAVLGCDLDNLPGIAAGNLFDPVSDCRYWPSLWANDLATYRPEVVGVLVGRWDTTDHLLNGQEVDITQPAWFQHLEAELDHVVSVLSSRGARVVLLTLPYFGPAQEAPNGSLWPEDQPSRVDDFNRILRDVAARHPKVVSVVDLNQTLDPGGHFAGSIDGVPVRWADGIHISKVGGEWLQGAILPSVAQLGLDLRASGGR